MALRDMVIEALGSAEPLRVQDILDGIKEGWGERIFDLSRDQFRDEVKILDKEAAESRALGDKRRDDF
jgi:hypothetical protein